MIPYHVTDVNMSLTANKSISFLPGDKMPEWHDASAVTFGL